MRDFRYPVKDNTYTVVDGDTVKVLLDRGWGDTKHTSLRINGIDSPESRTRKNLLERKAGKLVTEVVKAWLLEQAKFAQLYASSEEKPKYHGRTVGSLTITRPLKDTKATVTLSLSSFLLSHGLVLPYKGGKKQAWTDRKLKQIIRTAEDLLAKSE